VRGLSPHPIGRTSAKSFSAASPVHARHEGVANATDTDAERIHGDAEALRQIAPPLDSLPARFAVVLGDQLALIRPQRPEAAFEPIEPLFANGAPVVAFDDGSDRRLQGGPDAWLVEADVPAFAPDILEQDESRDDVAVPRRRVDGYYAGALERSTDAIERLVRQFVRGQAIPPIKIRDQPASHLEVLRPMRVDTVVEPFKQSGKCGLRKSW
jgi:hypothetical protein